MTPLVDWAVNLNTKNKGFKDGLDIRWLKKMDPKSVVSKQNCIDYIEK